MKFLWGQSIFYDEKKDRKRKTSRIGFPMHAQTQTAFPRKGVPLVDHNSKAPTIFLCVKIIEYASHLLC